MHEVAGVDDGIAEAEDALVAAAMHRRRVGQNYGDEQDGQTPETPHSEYCDYFHIWSLFIAFAKINVLLWYILH
jgi:hypothetical protein